MTKTEALKVAEVIGEADSGCYVCVGKLMDEMQKQFPRFNWRELVIQSSDGKWDQDSFVEVKDG